jgi:dTDP-4-amino-4,6-dideoxygalactose transaminase
MGTLGCFSFFPTKNLGALGEGGLVTTKDPDLAEKVRKLRVHGAKVKYFHEMIGGNFRLHELQAAFLRIKLKYLEAALAKRRQNAKRLSDILRERWKGVMPLESCVCQGQGAAKEVPSGTVLLPFACQLGEGEHTWNQFSIRVTGAGGRDALRDKLQASGIQSEIYYPRALHQQDCFPRGRASFPVAERLSREILALPLQEKLCPHLP